MNSAAIKLRVTIVLAITCVFSSNIFAAKQPFVVPISKNCRAFVTGLSGYRLRLTPVSDREPKMNEYEEVYNFSKNGTKFQIAFESPRGWTEQSIESLQWITQDGTSDVLWAIKLRDDHLRLSDFIGAVMENISKALAPEDEKEFQRLPNNFVPDGGDQSWNGRLILFSIPAKQKFSPDYDFKARVLFVRRGVKKSEETWSARITKGHLRYTSGE